MGFCFIRKNVIVLVLNVMSSKFLNIIIIIDIPVHLLHYQFNPIQQFQLIVALEIKKKNCYH